MSTVSTAPRLSLFAIEAELLQLIDQREDVLERMAAMSPDELTASPEIGQELSVVEGLIRQYLHGHLVAKADSIGFAVKEYEARAEARKAEAERMRASADRDAETAKRIKAMVLEVMQEFGEKKLPGRLFTITRQGNGGLSPLLIAQPDLIPDRLKMVMVKMSLDAWQHMRKFFEGAQVACEVSAPEPNGSAIRGILERGEGVPGARIGDRGEHVRIR